MRGIVQESARHEGPDDALDAIGHGSVAAQAAPDLGGRSRSGGEQPKGPVVERTVRVGLGQGRGIDRRADVEIEALYVVERDSGGGLAINQNGEPTLASRVGDNARD